MREASNKGVLYSVKNPVKSQRIQVTGKLHYTKYFFTVNSNKQSTPGFDKTNVAQDPIAVVLRKSLLTSLIDRTAECCRVMPAGFKLVEPDDYRKFPHPDEGRVGNGVKAVDIDGPVFEVGSKQGRVHCHGTILRCFSGDWQDVIGDELMKNNAPYNRVYVKLVWLRSTTPVIEYINKSLTGEEPTDLVDAVRTMAEQNKAAVENAKVGDFGPRNVQAAATVEEVAKAETEAYSSSSQISEQNNKETHHKDKTKRRNKTKPKE